MNPFFLISIVTLLLAGLIILSTVHQLKAEKKSLHPEALPSEAERPVDVSKHKNIVLEKETPMKETPLVKETPLEEKPVEFRTESELHTRALIGDDNFERMRDTVENLLQRHVADKCINVELTSGADSEEGARRLHSLLPGDPLTLRKNTESGLELVDVYSDGYRVGRLLLGDADKAIDVMKNSSLTGVYVAEQNCFGDCSYVDLRLILFFTPRIAAENEQQADTPYRFTINGPKPIILYQN